jgi:hypothetical protein
MNDFVNQYFAKMGKKFCKNIAVILPAILKCGSANTSEIAREMHHFTKKNFKSNDVKLYRFLQDPDFQVDDQLWRCNVNLIFDFLEKQKLIKEGDNIAINVDLTTSKRDFLILSASIILNGKAISLYFSIRKYPPKTWQISHKKFEKAFINELKHILSKKYNYTIVADRGFGNGRFISICEENGFDFVIRMNANLKLQFEDKKIKNLKEFQGQNAEFPATIIRWKKQYNFSITTRKEQTWFLLSSKNAKSPINTYENRFKIEKLFQDSKSSGFNIENTKIRKYDRFKRLLYLLVLTHALMVVVGSVINDTKVDLKKKFQLHIDSLLVYLNSVNTPFLLFSGNLSKYYIWHIIIVDNFVGE